jgi:hypothetical protein
MIERCADARGRPSLRAVAIVARLLQRAMRIRDLALLTAHGGRGSAQSADDDEDAGAAHDYPVASGAIEGDPAVHVAAMVDAVM